MKIDKNDIALIRKFFQKQCTDKEKETFINWIVSLEHESKLRKIMSDHWDEINVDEVTKDPDLDSIMGQLHRAINIQFAENRKDQAGASQFFWYFSRIAAILVLPLLAFTIWSLAVNNQIILDKSQPVYAEIISPPAARIHFELPDGTTGWLNSGSTLQFPYRFDSDEREVLLTGEGYFDVFPDKKKPFVVSTNNSRITALGTIFNILDHSQDENVIATLVEGTIRVEKLTDEGKVLTLGELEPNQQFIFSKSSDIFESKTVVPDYYTSWKDGKLVFRNKPMKEVIIKLSRWYNVDFEIADEELEDIIFRATFVDETLSEVLNVLNLTASIGHIEHKRELLQDGSYSKKKITLYLNQ